MLQSRHFLVIVPVHPTERIQLIWYVQGAMDESPECSIKRYHRVPMPRFAYSEPLLELFAFRPECS